MLTSFLNLANGVILIALGVAVAWFWRTYDARKKAEQDAASDRKQYRETQMAAQKALREDLNTEIKARADGDQAGRELVATEARDRQFWQLKRESELASIASILEESTQAHKLLSSIASTTRHLENQVPRVDADIRQLNERLTKMQDHILQLASHAKS